MIETEFKPNWCVPPGHTITELMFLRKVKLEDLSTAAGYSVSKMQKLISGSIKIDQKRAGVFADLLGFDEDFWLRRDAVFQQRKKDGKKVIK